MDIQGPLLTALGQRKFLLVAVDYFTKWVEAEPLPKVGPVDDIIALVQHLSHMVRNHLSVDETVQLKIFGEETLVS